MVRLRHSYFGFAALALSVALVLSIAPAAQAGDRGRGEDWERHEAAIRAAELCENWSGDQRKRRAAGAERWEREQLSTGERLNAVDRGRRQAERLVRQRGCESAEVRDLLDFFHRFVAPLFD